ncbi:MAG TPA: formylmethanofuran dehydrogenase subunit C [Methylococcaceae bacterium]|nr:formylmethanofuran dehydrogenase subunit C [Methylococcaceae bacterium]
MSALTFTLKNRPEQRVDMSPLSCHLLTGLEPVDIAAITLQCGKQKLRVDELFSISGFDTQHIVIKNSFSKLDYIGKDLNSGEIRVEGDVGAYCGLSMQSGLIKILGNTGIYAGCEMKKGQIEILGDAGDFLGGALPGNKNGMKGGVILVKGNAGDRVGDHLRRGTILIEGNAGDYCGSRMIAGTIAVMGSTGKHIGYAMRRGTLLLWHSPHLSANFNDCGQHTLAFLPMLFNSFAHLDSAFAHKTSAFNRVRRFAGDMAEIGRGEILVKA